MQTHNPIDVQIGKCMRDMRFKIDWPVERLATAIGVTRARMFEYGSGEARIEAHVLSKLCHVSNSSP